MWVGTDTEESILVPLRRTGAAIRAELVAGLQTKDLAVACERRSGTGIGIQGVVHERMAHVAAGRILSAAALVALEQAHQEPAFMW